MRTDQDESPEAVWLHPAAIWLAYCGFLALATAGIILWRST